MSKTVLALTLLAAAFVCALPAGLAQAQPARVFVAAQGSDGNPCTFALPCRTFQHAHDVVAAKGEIDVLDPAGYGALTIGKSISIQGHGFAGISVPSGTGITIASGASGRVNLRGLLLDGLGSGVNGILFMAGASLSIQDCLIRNFTSAGILFNPSVSSSLFVSTTLASDNDIGIYVVPSTAGIAVTGVIDRVAMNYSGSAGLGAESTTTGTVQITVSDSVAARNAVGIVANSAAGATAIMVRNSTIANNDTGVIAGNSAGTVRITRSTITGNGIGFSVAGSAALVSLGDNVLEGNATNGAATTTVGYH